MICNRFVEENRHDFPRPNDVTRPYDEDWKQITEVIMKHEKASKEEADKRAEELLELVGFQMPKSV